jgi:hypothetical protein
VNALRESPLGQECAKFPYEPLVARRPRRRGMAAAYVVQLREATTS